MLADWTEEENESTTVIVYFSVFYSSSRNFQQIPYKTINIAFVILTIHIHNFNNRAGYMHRLCLQSINVIETEMCVCDRTLLQLIIHCLFGAISLSLVLNSISS